MTMRRALAPAAETIYACARPTLRLPQRGSCDTRGKSVAGRAATASPPPGKTLEL